MRMIASCLILAGGALALAPSSKDFRGRYSAPDLERYTVRPGISLTVEYGSDHRACRILIEPPRDLFRSDKDLPPMSSAEVDEILEELVPVKSRGAAPLTSISSMPCAESRRTEYPGLTIDRMRNICSAPEPPHDVRTEISYKRDACEKVE